MDFGIVAILYYCDEVASGLKKILLFACIILLCLAVYVFIWMFSSIDRPGTADNVQIDIGSSERFTQEEIESAADLVVSEFGFLNSELIYLWYDESISDLKIENSYLDLDRDSTIIFSLQLLSVNWEALVSFLPVRWKILAGY